MMPVSGSGMMSTKRPCMLPERIKTEKNNLIERGCAGARVPAAARGPGRPGLRRCRQRGAGLPGERSFSGAGRTEITGSREGAKPRSFDERRTFFPRALGPSRWSPSQAEAILCHSRRPPGGLACTRAGSCSGAGGRSGLRSGEVGSRSAAFLRRFFRNDGNWQLLLAFLPMDVKHVLYIFL
jgi:hypothetical protein